MVLLLAVRSLAPGNIAPPLYLARINSSLFPRETLTGKVDEEASLLTSLVINCTPRSPSHPPMIRSFPQPPLPQLKNGFFAKTFTSAHRNYFDSRGSNISRYRYIRRRKNIDGKTRKGFYCPSFL